MSPQVKREPDGHLGNLTSHVSLKRGVIQVVCVKVQEHLLLPQKVPSDIHLGSDRKCCTKS